MVDFTKNLQQLYYKINEIKKTNNCIQQIDFIAVSKGFSVRFIEKLYQLGHRDFGENYVQELQNKATDFIDKNVNINWHFIGAIQSNKIKIIAKYASWVHSLEKKEHALKLNTERSDKALPLNILIEVRISKSLRKHGLKNLDAIFDLAMLVKSQKNLKLRGLMGIATDTADNKLILEEFLTLKNIYQTLQANGFNLDCLSMGMSNDYEMAIIAGATHLRIGRLIFGDR